MDEFPISTSKPLAADNHILTKKKAAQSRRLACNSPETEPTAETLAELDKARQRLGVATGTNNRALQERLTRQAFAVLRETPDENHARQTILAALGALEDIAPRNATEGMLATHMLASHEAIMDCMARRARSTDVEMQNMYLKNAEKMMRIYILQKEALAKGRGERDQKIVVERVTVQSGGQAIVGNVEAPVTPRRARSKRPSLADGRRDTVTLPDPLAAPLRGEKRPQGEMRK